MQFAKRKTQIDLGNFDESMRPRIKDEVEFVMNCMFDLARPTAVERCGRLERDLGSMTASYGVPLD